MSVFERISRTVKEHPWGIIAVALLVTIVLGLGLMFLQGQVTYHSLLPEGFPSIQALETLRNEFGGISYEYVLIKADRVTDPAIIEFLISLRNTLKKDPRFNQGQIQTVAVEGEEVPVIQDYLNPLVANIQREMKARGFDVPLSTITNDTIQMFTGINFQQLAEDQYLSNPQAREEMVGRFISDDYNSALVIIKSNPDLSQAEQIQLGGDLEDLFTDGLSDVPGAEISLAGDATLARDFERHIRNKTVLLFLIAIAVVIAALFLAFRRFSDTVLPIVVMTVGLVWTFGFSGWVKIPYSVASIAIMPIILGSALTFVVPFMARYYEEMESHFRSVRAVGVALMTIGVGLFLAAVTNVFGFLVFEFSVLPPLRDFGLTCAVGTIFVFVLSASLMPAVMVVRDRVYEKMPVDERQKRKTHFDGLSRRKRRGIFTRAVDRALHAASGLAIRHSTLVIIIFAVLILAGFVQIRGMTTDSDLRKLVPGNLPGIAADYEIEKEFGGQQQDTIYVRGDVLDPNSLQAMLDMENAIPEDERNDYMGEKLYTRDGMIGLPDALKSANGGVLPRTREEVEHAIDTAGANGAFLKGTLLSIDNEAALIALNAHGAETAGAIDRKMQVLNDNCERFLPPLKLDYQVGGITALTYDMTENIVPTQTISSVLSLFLCALILIIIFRSIPYGLITLTVALAGVSGEVGFLSLMGWPLDIVTSLVSALVIGIGVNFGILFTHRYIQEREQRNSLPVDSIKATMMNLGRANVIAAIATVSGFLIIMLSEIVPLRRFGGVTAFAIGWCLVTSLTLMPALLYRASGRLERQAATDGSALAEEA